MVPGASLPWRLHDPQAAGALFASLAHETVALWRGFQATVLSAGWSEAVDRAAVDATEALVARVRVAASAS